MAILDPESIPQQNQASVKKKKKTSKKDLELGELQNNLQVLLLGGFEIGSQRLGNHWILSVEESEKIAAPTARILDRLEVSERLNKYSDYIALVAALGVTIVPRLLISAEMKRSVKPAPVVSQIREVKSVEEPVAASNGPTTEPGTFRGAQTSIKESIPSISF